MGVGARAEVVTRLDPVTRIRVRWVTREEDALELEDPLRAWWAGWVWAIATTGIRAHKGKKPSIIMTIRCIWLKCGEGMEEILGMGCTPSPGVFVTRSTKRVWEI
jgi:hypothetical protein